MPDFFSFKTHKFLQREVLTKIAEAERLYRVIEKGLEQIVNIAEHMLSLRGHTATTLEMHNLYKLCTSRHDDIIFRVTELCKRQDKTTTAEALLLIEGYIKFLLTADHVSGWDSSPRQEVALRAEIELMMKRVCTLNEDIKILMPGKIVLLMTTRVEAFKELAALEEEFMIIQHTPRNESFPELRTFMEKLLNIDARMHNMRRTLKDLQ